METVIECKSIDSIKEDKMGKSFCNKKAMEENKIRKKAERDKYLAIFDRADPTGLGFAENTEHEIYDFGTDF